MCYTLKVGFPVALVMPWDLQADDRDLAARVCAKGLMETDAHFV